MHKEEITYLSTLDDVDVAALGLPSNKTYLASASKDRQIKLWSVDVQDIDDDDDDDRKEKKEIKPEKKKPFRYKTKAGTRFIVSLNLMATVGWRKVH